MRSTLLALAALVSVSLLPSKVSASDRAYSLRVPAAAQAQAGGGVSVTPSSIDFAPLESGQSATQSIAITNGGTKPATLSSRSVSGTGFSVASDDCATTVAPGQTCYIGISFSPLSSGSFVGAYSVTYIQDGKSGSSVSMLSGQGVFSAGGPMFNWDDANLMTVMVGGSSSDMVHFWGDSDDPVTIVSSELIGAPAGLSIVMDLCSGGTWARGWSCSLQLVYSPSQVASLDGNTTLVLRAADGRHTYLPVQGRSAAPTSFVLVGPSVSSLSAEMDGAAFGSATASITYRNMSGVAKSLSPSGSGPLEVKSNGCMNVAANATCVITIGFKSDLEPYMGSSGIIGFIPDGGDSFTEPAYIDYGVIRSSFEVVGAGSTVTASASTGRFTITVRNISSSAQAGPSRWAAADAMFGETDGSLDFWIINGISWHSSSTCESATVPAGGTCTLTYTATRPAKGSPDAVSPMLSFNHPLIASSRSIRGSLRIRIPAQP